MFLLYAWFFFYPPDFPWKGNFSDGRKQVKLPASAEIKYAQASSQEDHHRRVARSCGKARSDSNDHGKIGDSGSVSTMDDMIWTWVEIRSLLGLLVGISMIGWFAFYPNDLSHDRFIASVDAQKVGWDGS